MDNLDASSETTYFFSTGGYPCYQRLAQDRDSWAVTGGDLADAVEALTQQIQTLSALHETLRPHLSHLFQEETRQALASVAEAVKQAMHTVLTEAIQTPTAHLSKVIRQAENQFARHAHDAQGLPSLSLGLVILGACLGGFYISSDFSLKNLLAFFEITRYDFPEG